MIGDARARGKVQSTTKNDGSQIKRGKRYITNTPSASDGGGDRATKAAARAAYKGPPRGTGSRDKQNPKEQRARKIEAWCAGHSRSYR
jgi:hypothetical protein